MSPLSVRVVTRMQLTHVLRAKGWASSGLWPEDPLETDWELPVDHVEER